MRHSSNNMLTLFARVIQTTWHTWHYLVSLLTFFTLAWMLWQTFSQRYLRMRYRVLPFHSPPPLYNFLFNTSYCMLKCVQIKVALDEMVAEGKEVTFKWDVDVDIYSNILGLMAKCDMAAIHCAKMKTLRVHWAKIRRYVKWSLHPAVWLRCII